MRGHLVLYFAYVQPLLHFSEYGLAGEWRECLVNDASSLAYIQQAERLLDSSSQPTDLARELASFVHMWDPIQQLESLRDGQGQLW